MRWSVVPKEREERLKIARRAFALGVLLGAMGAVVSAWIADIDMDISFGNNAIQFHGNPLVAFGAGLTVGNTIHYNSNIPPAYLACVTTHERRHTFQYPWWGPSFIPVYATIFIVTRYRAHPFEVDARDEEPLGCPP